MFNQALRYHGIKVVNGPSDPHFSGLRVAPQHLTPLFGARDFSSAPILVGGRSTTCVRILAYLHMLLRLRGSIKRRPVYLDLKNNQHHVQVQDLGEEQSEIIKQPP
jgi:hypothetical protein